MNFQIIVCFNENGEAIKTIHLTGSPENSISVPHLRADPTTGNLLGARFGKSEIFGIKMEKVLKSWKWIKKFLIFVQINLDIFIF